MPEHWHVLGAGAMGCLFAASLQRAGYDATLVLRDPSEVDSVRLQVERGNTSEETDLAVDTNRDSGHISHLLVTTKAYDVRQAVTGIAHRLNKDSRVLILANGMGFSEELRSVLPWLDLYHGTTTEGAYRIAPWHVCHAGRGQTRIGQPGMREPPDWFQAWPAALGSCLWDADISEALWQKLVINCVINPLTALHRCRNGELATREDLSDSVSLLCSEIALISRAAGHCDTADKLESLVADVICGTANNRSSMLQDVLQGRPTEIHYITGHLLAVARDNAVDAPLNTALFEGVNNIDH